MDELKSSGKPFDISKWEVQEAWEKVRANKGAPGVDGCSIEEFEKDLKNNLYKIWNRMSSGSYFPPPVLAVEIPKSHGAGTRVLGVPAVADRVAQTVVARRLERKVEPIFHDDSYGYRRDGRRWMRYGSAGSAAGRPTGERRDKPAWRRDMRTSCIEGVAIHGDLGSCVGVREDAGEALTEGDVGWVIEPRNHQSGVPTPSQWPEGNIAGRASASCQRTPRGQRACACVESSGARTGRSRGCPSGCDGRAGRSGNAEAVSPR